MASIILHTKEASQVWDLLKLIFWWKTFLHFSSANYLVLFLSGISHSFDKGYWRWNRQYILQNVFQKGFKSTTYRWTGSLQIKNLHSVVFFAACEEGPGICALTLTIFSLFLIAVSLPFSLLWVVKVVQVIHQRVLPTYILYSC